MGVQYALGRKKIDCSINKQTRSTFSLVTVENLQFSVTSDIWETLRFRVITQNILSRAWHGQSGKKNQHCLHCFLYWTPLSLSISSCPAGQYCAWSLTAGLLGPLASRPLGIVQLIMAAGDHGKWCYIACW